MISAGSALLILMLGAVIARSMIHSYLRGDAFRSMLEQRIGALVQSEVKLRPISYDGLRVQCGGLSTAENKAWGIKSVEAHHVGAEVSLRRFWDRVWQVDDVNVEQLEIDLADSGPVVASRSAPSEESMPAVRGTSTPGWLPDRVEVSKARVANFGLRWKDGRINETSIMATPAESGWNLAVTGGDILHTRFPPLRIKELDLRWRAPLLIIHRAELASPEGKIQIRGEAEAVDAYDVEGDLTNVDIAPMLPPDWRYRLKGQATGTFTARAKSQKPATSTASIRLTGASLEALPVLDEIARFTHLAHYRRLQLTTAKGELRVEGDHLTVRQMVLESAGLIRMEGAFEIRGEVLSGEFVVGVTPASLQWLPGSQERVFTLARDGYLWTPLRLTGTTKTPKEDLSERLAAAAAGHAIDTATGTTLEIIKTGKDAARGILDRILGN